MPVEVSPNPLLSLLAVVLAILLVLLILQIRRLRRRTTRMLIALTLGTAVAVAGAAGLLAYGVYSSYVQEHTWTFSFYVEIRTNGTTPDAIVVPSTADGSLLKGLALDSGMANWSFVDTVHGRGLYVAFTGNASVSVYLSHYPPPAPLPNTSLTMMNGSGSPPEVWMYHAGDAAVSISFFGDYMGTGLAELARGWSVHWMVPPPAVP